MSHDIDSQPKSFREVFAAVTEPARGLFTEALPAGVGFLHTTGSMCLFLAGLQIVTGILMAFYYTPSPDVAWESVKYVEEKVAFGPIIHGLHHWGSSAFVVVAFIHMLRVFSFGAYKGRRKWTWLVGVALLTVVLGFGFTGYLLPWDMKAYFGTKVGANIAGYAPFVGPYAREFLLGGERITELTLPRFYSLHTHVLPAALIGLIGLHLYFVRLYGITPPGKRDDETADYPTIFYPTQAVRDSLMVLVLFCIVYVLAWRVGADLGDKADPTTTTFAPHPEWYFLGMQQLLRYFKGDLQIIGTVIIPFGVMLLLILLPFIDRNPERRPSKRPFALSLGAIGVVLIAGLTIQGYSALQDERQELALVAEADAATLAAEAAEAEEAANAEAADAAAAADGAEIVISDRQIRRGEQIFEANRCAECHTGDGVGEELNIPPSLDHVADRFTVAGLFEYMGEVPQRRYERKNRFPMIRMPHYKFSGRELEAVVGYLTTLTEPDLFEPVDFDFSDSSEEKIAQGEALYESESCDECHQLNGRGTRNAPDLTGVGGRLKARFIFEMIKHPQALVPGTTMEDALLDDDEIEALVAFMMSQE